MEKMNGGGHFSAAGLQRENAKIAELREELLATLKETRNESNIKN
jgi:c-di-AMP phosphodiesterase-like protein